MVRLPVFAGKFYPDNPRELKLYIDNLLKEFPVLKKKAIGCLVPHAGYVYSGKVAAATLSGIDIPSRVIMLGPNHTGMGEPLSIMASGTWRTPLGDVKVDEGLSEAVLKESVFLKEDDAAHSSEHSLEVELPFLQVIKKDFSIVPICLMSQDTEVLKSIGLSIARAIESLSLKDSCLIVASSDMTHYEGQDEALDKDSKAIGAILSLDEDMLMLKIAQLGISMCGYAPAVVMISAAKALGAVKGNLIMYQTSGDVNRDKDSVVGYAGITLS